MIYGTKLWGQFILDICTNLKLIDVIKFVLSISYFYRETLLYGWLSEVK